MIRSSHAPELCWIDSFIIIILYHSSIQFNSIQLNSTQLNSAQLNSTQLKPIPFQKTKRSIILKQILSPIIQILLQVLFSSIVLAKIGAGRVPLCGLNNRKAPSLPFIEPTERYPARPKFRLQCGASEIRARLWSTFVLEFPFGEIATHQTFAYR